jgi:hypothetical protein
MIRYDNTALSAMALVLKLCGVRSLPARALDEPHDRRVADVVGFCNLLRAMPVDSPALDRFSSLSRRQFLLATEFDPLGFGSRPTLARPLPDQFAFELGYAAELREHQAPVRRRDIVPGIAKRA